MKRRILQLKKQQDRKKQKKNGKWKKWDFRYIAEKQVLRRVRTLIKLALDYKTLSLWKKT